METAGGTPLLGHPIDGPGLVQLLLHDGLVVLVPLLVLAQLALAKGTTRHRAVGWVVVVGGGLGFVVTGWVASSALWNMPPLPEAFPPVGSPMARPLVHGTVTSQALWLLVITANLALPWRSWATRPLRWSTWLSLGVATGAMVHNARVALGAPPGSFTWQSGWTFVVVVQLFLIHAGMTLASFASHGSPTESWARCHHRVHAHQLLAAWVNVCLFWALHDGGTLWTAGLPPLEARIGTMIAVGTALNVATVAWDWPHFRGCSWFSRWTAAGAGPAA